MSEQYLPTPRAWKRVKLPEDFLLSVLVPVFNEVKTLEAIIASGQEVELPKEIIIVDDYSTDGTREILKKMENQSGIHVFYHEKDRGKGAALRTALEHIRGTHVVIQDADLEYDPDDYPLLLK